METASVRGVKPLTNGRGPFVGSVHIVACGDFEIICGKDRMAKGLGNAPNGVAIVRTTPNVGYFMYFPDPVAAETVAKMIESLETMTEHQLEKMGFVELRRGLIKV